MKTLHQHIKIPECSKDTIARADDVFSYIDSDFDSCDVKSPKTPETELAVLEMDKDATFKEIFTVSEDMHLTQAQILYFVRNHKDKLRTDSYATFFLFKGKNSEFFVAHVYFYDDGRLEVGMDPFSHGLVWYAGGRHRFVFPQLALKHLDSNPSDSLTLRVKKIEDWIHNFTELKDIELRDTLLPL